MSVTNTGLVELTIDGRAVRVPEGTTVYDAARLNGIVIPTLCHLQSQTPVGVCRLCVVDTGARVLSASCVRPVEAGMKVSTSSEKVLAARKTLLELLMADHRVAVRAATAFRGLRTGNVGEAGGEWPLRDLRDEQLREVRTILHWPSPWTTTRAFCATDASAAATRSKTILCWGEWAKDIPRGLRLI